MPTIVLNPVTNLEGNPASAETTLNANFDALEAQIQELLSRTGEQPNQMEADLDMNSFRILNASGVLSGGGTAADTDYDNSTSELVADNVQDAIDELDNTIDGLGADVDEAAFKFLSVVDDYRVQTNSGSTFFQPYYASGNAVTPTGTLSVPARSGATFLDSLNRERRTSASAALDINSGWQLAGGSGEGFYRAISGSALGGGFRIVCIFSPVTMKSDMRIYWLTREVGLGLSGDPSAFTNIFGFGKDTTDVNLQFMHNDNTGTATKVDTGITMAQLQGSLCRMTLSAPLSGSPCTARIELLGTATEFTGSATLNLPRVDQRSSVCIINNTGGSTTTAVTIDAVRATLRYSDIMAAFP